MSNTRCPIRTVTPLRVILFLPALIRLPLQTLHRLSSAAMRDPLPIRDYVLTSHACQMAADREIPLKLVRDVLAAPDDRKVVRAGRIVDQSLCEVSGAEKPYLMRVVVDVDRRPAEFVTVYRTNRIAKYWGSER